VPNVPDDFEYDGVALFEIKDIVTFAVGFSDQYYINVISVDEDRFLDKGVNLMRVVGAGTQILRAGKAVVDVGDNLGIWQEWEQRGGK